MPVALLLWALLLLVEKRNNFNLIGPLVVVLIGAAAWLKFRKRMDQNLSKNFSLKEFESRDGSPTPPDVLQNLRELAKNLEVIRAHFGKPIKINSGYRSPAYNKTIPNAASNSMHTKGKAADIVIAGVTPSQLAIEIEKLITLGKIKQGGLGRYPNFVHYDIRGKKARW